MVSLKVPGYLPDLGMAVAGYGKGSVFSEGGCL